MSNYTDVDLVVPGGPFVGSTTGCSPGWTSSWKRGGNGSPS